MGTLITENSCCFTGHREAKLIRASDLICDDLELAIKQAIEDGYTTFITGMAYGVDIWAGEKVVDLQKKNRSLHLIAAVPFDSFEDRWGFRWKNRYRNLLKKADDVHYICDGYAAYAYQKRNEWMVDRSSRVIAVYNGGSGGTRNTINYAKIRNVPVVYIEG